MNICCIYSLDDQHSEETPLTSPSQIAFGISIILSVLKAKKYDVGLLVLTPDSDIHGMIDRYTKDYRPSLFCLTSVSSQYNFICKVAKVIKDIDPSIYIILGGQHATLNPGHAISSQYIDCNI